MMEILTGRSELIYDILVSEDFDPEELKAELERGHYSPDELNRAACAYAFQCMDDIELYVGGMVKTQNEQHL